MIIKSTLSLIAVAFGWLAVLAGVMYATSDAPAALVLMPTETLLQNLPDGISIVGQNDYVVTLESESPGLAKTLYAAGAFVVLPAGLLGCAPLTS